MRRVAPRWLAGVSTSEMRAGGVGRTRLDGSGMAAEEGSSGWRAARGGGGGGGGGGVLGCTGSVRCRFARGVRLRTSLSSP